MPFSFFSMITERPRFGSVIFNLVAFSDEASVVEAHDAFVAAADIIQSRFPYMQFLVEACPNVTSAEVAALDNAFEIAEGSNLFLMPFGERLRLPDPAYALVDFRTYTWLFDMLRGEEGKEPEVDIDGLWEQLYAEEGLICFRLVLPKK